MTTDLYKLADNVESEQDLLNFIEALTKDREDEEMKEKINPSSPYGPGANGWENGSILTFLDRARSWGQATIEGQEFYQKAENPWKRLAHILHAGKFYE